MAEKRRTQFRDKVCLALATIFGVGYTPFMPGTAASIVAVIVFIFVKSLPVFLLITAVTLLASFPVSSKAEKIFKEKDCKKIVIDDFLGMLVSLLFIPHDFRLVIAGFILFRIFDMLKIPPADRLEKVEGGRGIVGDDLAAGIYANISLHLLNLLLKIIS